MAQNELKAGSFTIQAGEAVQQRQTGIQLGQTGIQGAGRAAAADPLQRVVLDTSTSDLLMKLGSKIIEPMIQQQQTKKFLEGAQRVAQGEALKEIVDEQPWFTTIFGTSSSVQGARAMAQMKGVDDYLTDIANNMPEYQKLSSKEFGDAMTSKMQQFMTGDAVTDAALQMKMVESSGSLFKAHTKAHYKWTQDSMQQATVGYMQSGGHKLKALTGQLLDGTMSQKDYDEARADYINNLMPLEGQSAESYWGGIQAATLDALANGNHHAANAIFDSGLFNSAPLDVRKTMIDARHTYEKRTQETAGFYEYGPRIGQLKGMAAAGVLTGNEILAEVDKINADYQTRFGMTRPLFSRKEFESIISGNISKIYNREEALRNELAREGRADARDAAKAQVKAETELRKQEQLVGLVQMGAGNMATLAGYTQREIDNAVFQGASVIAANGGDVGRYLVQQYNEGGEHVNPLYQNQLQAGMRAAKKEGHSGASFERSHAMVKQLSKEPGGTAAAMAYLGDDAVRMLKYDQLVQSNIAPEVAYQLSFADPLDGTRKSNDKEIGEKIVKEVNNAQPGFFGKMFSGDEPLTEQSKRVLVTRVAQNYDKLASNLNLDDPQAVKVALDVAKKELDVLGPYIIDRGADRKPVYQLIGSDEETAGKVFAEYLANEARKSGILAELPGNGKRRGQDSVSFAADVALQGPIPAVSRWWDRTFASEPNVTIVRLPDSNGVGQFTASIVTPEGDTALIHLDSASLREYYEKSKHFKD